MCAGKLLRPQLGRTTTGITDQIENDVMSTDTFAAPPVPAGFDINAQCAPSHKQGRQHVE